MIIYSYFVQGIDNLSRKNIKEKVNDIIAITSYGISPGVYFDDIQSVEDAVRGLKLNRNIEIIQINTNDDELFYFYSKDNSDIDFLKEKIKQKKNGFCDERDIFFGRTEINYRNQSLGTLVICYSLREINSNINELKNYTAIFSSIILIIGFLMAVFILTMYFNPISMITKKLSDVAEGNFSVRAITKRGGEIKKLADSFNKMTGDLANAYDELKNMNQELEIQVEKRTAKLVDEIKERKKANKKLKESGAFLQRVIDSMPFGIMIIDKTKKIRQANNAALNLMGYKSFDEINCIICHKTVCPAEVGKCPIIDFGQKVDSSERILLTKDNVDIPILKSVIEISMEDEPVLLETFMDLREIKAAEEQIRKLNEDLEKIVDERTIQLKVAMENLKIENEERKKTQEQLIIAKEKISDSLEKEKQLNDLKSRFISMISHEYRTPLTVVMTSTYILEKYFEEGNTEKFNKQIERVKQSIDLMTDLLENILIIDRSEKLKDVQFLKININSLVKSSINRTEDIDNNKHRIVYEFPPYDLFVESDTRILEVVVNNIINNAVKFSPNGKKVSVLIQEVDNNALIKISDEGIGIPEEDKHLIWETFHRGRNVGAITGTGLGLSIVKDYIERINGTVSFTSELHIGSEFIITLPKNK